MEQQLIKMGDTVRHYKGSYIGIVTKLHKNGNGIITVIKHYNKDEEKHTPFDINAKDVQKYFIKESEVSNLICPFCKENEFDVVGLKYHYLRGYCEVYNNIEV